MFGYYDSMDSDSTGAGTRSRARDRRRSMVTDRGRVTGAMGSMVGGPMRDPAWDAFFQRLEEGGVDRVMSGPSFQVAPSMATLGFDPTFQSSPVLEQGLHDAQTGRNTFATPNPAMNALLGVVEEDDRRVQGSKRSSAPVSSTGQSRLRVRKQRGGERA